MNLLLFSFVVDGKVLKMTFLSLLIKNLEMNSVLNVLLCTSSKQKLDFQKTIKKR